MDIKQDEFDQSDMAIWETVKAITDVTTSLENTKEDNRAELKALYSKLMEGLEWTNQFTIE